MLAAPAFFASGAKLYFLGLCGSLGSQSSNRLLLEVAQALVPSECRLDIESSIGEFPHFNPDLEVSDYQVVTSFVARVRESAGVVVSSPVYAGGYPGVLKNALDWLVGSDRFVEKPFMTLSASGRIPEAEETLVRVLETMSGRHASDASIVVPILGQSLNLDDVLKSVTHSRLIGESLERFASYIGERS